MAPSSSDPIPVLLSALTLQVELRWTELQDLLLPPLFSYQKVSNWFCLQNSHSEFFSAPFLIYVSCLLMHLSWKSAVALTFINRLFYGSHDFFSVQFDTFLMYFYYSIIEILWLSLFDIKKFQSFYLKLLFTPHSIVYTQPLALRPLKLPSIPSHLLLFCLNVILCQTASNLSCTYIYFIFLYFKKNLQISQITICRLAVCLYQGSKGADASHSTYYALPERNPFNPTFLLDFNVTLKTFTPLLGLSWVSWRMSGFFLYVFFCLSCASLACLRKNHVFSTDEPNSKLAV